MELSVAGKHVYAATGGRAPAPDAPTILFVHGAGMDHSVWALQARYFAHHGRNALAFDLPGHGRSEGPPLASVSEVAAWLAQAMAAAGFDKAAVVGHSFGALAALELAAREPARVSALALLAAAAPMSVHPDLLAAAAADRPLACELMADWGHSRRAHIGGALPPGTWLKGASQRLLERSAAGVLYADLLACNAYEGAMAAAAAIRCPALVLLGEGDRMTPPEAAGALTRAIPGAETVVLAACGHLMMSEQPARVLDRLADFI